MAFQKFPNNFRFCDLFKDFISMFSLKLNGERGSDLLFSNISKDIG